MSTLKELRLRFASGNSVPTTSIRITSRELDNLVRELQGSSQPTQWNGMTDDETSATASVMGLSKPKPQGTQVPEALVEAGRRLIADREKNDHFTADPIYTVQREVRIYGLDSDYAEEFVWIEDGEVSPSGLSERLERRFNRGWILPERYRRVGYCTRWWFVDAYLTYDAAKERVEYENRKHDGTYRTYVESGYRNQEWKALQAWLMHIAGTLPKQSGQQTNLESPEKVS